MDLFKSDATAEVAVEKDSLGGFRVLDSGLVPMTIKAAFIDDYAGGSKNLTVVCETEDGSTYTEQECVWSKNTESKYYKDKKTGQKKELIGYSKMNSLAKLLTGKDLESSTYETKVHELYSKDAGAKVPTPRPTLTDWQGLQVFAGVLKTTKNKQTKGEIVNGKQTYVDTAETRDENNVDKWFDENKLTLVEKNGNKPAEFVDQWEKANTGRVIDKTNKTLKSGAVGGDPAAVAPPLQFT